MILHKLKPTITAKTIDSRYPNIYIDECSSMAGYHIIFDGVKFYVLNNEYLLEYTYGERQAVADTLGNCYGTELRDEVIELTDMFRQLYIESCFAYDKKKCRCDALKQLYCLQGNCNFYKSKVKIFPLSKSIMEQVDEKHNLPEL